MKISVVGGGGRVGSCAAYSLLVCGVAQELAIIDASTEFGQGEALDLLHASSFDSSTRVYFGGPEALDGSDIVLITAGLRRKPDESRLELLHRNVGLFRSILEDVRKARLPEGAIIVVVTNPVDIMTQVAADAGIVSVDRVIGLGTLIDTARLRSLLADHLRVDPTCVDALMLGEHGDTMVPVLSTASINGVPLQSFPGSNPETLQQIAEQARTGGGKVLGLKGGPGWVVASAVRHLITAIADDCRSVLPVSTLQKGALGISGVCLSLPTVIGRGGAIDIIEIGLADEELSALHHSAAVLKDRISQLGS